jgi:2-alkyl-3-oxoalkanoate reductase
MNVCFIGTGNIAHAHAQALLSVSDAKLIAVFDVNPAAANTFAKRYKAEKTYATIDEALADSKIDVFHILTPPDSHCELVLKIQAAGKRVFVEKPVVTTKEQLTRLSNLSEVSKNQIGINQNSCFHPSFLKVSQALTSGRLGKPRYVNCTFEPFLKQLSAGQFSHWMFNSPLNLLLEQAVHPLAQIAAVTRGVDCEKLSVMQADAIPVSSSASFVPELTATFEQGCIPITFRMRVGASYPVWQLNVVCDDGYAVADMVTGEYSIVQRTKFLDAGDNAITGSKFALSKLRQSIGNFKNYCLAQAGLKERNDSFFLGIKGSVHAYYGSIRTNQPFIANANFGLGLVNTCSKIAAKLQPQFLATAPVQANTSFDNVRPLVTVFGATGFIGKHTVTELLNKGYQVRAVARSIKNLGHPFDHPNVEILRADAKVDQDVDSVVKGSRFVVNLAHGGGGANYEAIRMAMVDSAARIAKACENHLVECLVHVGSIASLYLGDPNETITGATQPDPNRIDRGDYARAKAESDDEIANAAKEMKTRVINLRPGLVVGEGTSPLHSGLGFFNNEQHMIGWNEGENPLPFVLASDVASAIELCLSKPLNGFHAFNLVGDFQPTAKQYFKLLAEDIQRPLVFHPSSVNGLMLVEYIKWTVKRVAGKKAPVPQKRDLLSRGIKAKFNCSDVKAALGWTPIRDERIFRDQATRTATK